MILPVIYRGKNSSSPSHRGYRSMVSLMEWGH